MAQITIYLDKETMAQVKAGAKAAGQSQSQWIADSVRLRVRKEWPATVRALAGAWPDFPLAEKIRSLQASDSRREAL